MSVPTAVAANNTPLSPLRFLERSAAVFPERTAVVHGDRTYSYREFGDEVAALARVLRERIQPGDRVAYLAPNVPEMLFAHFAVPLAGGVLIALNSRLAGPELEYILDHSGTTILFVDSEFVGSVTSSKENVESLREIVEIPDSTVPYPDVPTGIVTGQYADLIAEGEALSDQPLHWGVDDEQQCIAINYTSGTTGKPKGVMYSHRGAYLNSLGETFHNGFDGATKYLWTLPMFHCNGWCTPWAVTQAAGTHICLRAVRADAIWDAIDNLGVTHLCGAPTVCSTIADADQAHKVDALRITTAGAPPSPTIIGKLEDIGVTVVHVYGLTEVYGPYTICEYQEAWDDKPQSERAALLSRQGVGMVQAENARVVDAEMNDVPADGQTMGEIVLRGNNVMLGYYRDEGRDSRSICRWLVPFRRPRRHASRRIHPAQGPREGHHHLRRRENLHRRGGAGDHESPRGDRRGSRRRSRREVGRAPEGIRGAGQGITGIRRRHRRAHPHFAGRVQGSPRHRLPARPSSHPHRQGSQVPATRRQLTPTKPGYLHP